MAGGIQGDTFAPHHFHVMNNDCARANCLGNDFDGSGNDDQKATSGL
jgi:hypothetical protein